MFSRNTSKTLTFTVTSDEPIDEGLELDNDMCGWLLKKRRKRMQGIRFFSRELYIKITLNLGWAKRWFELSTTGILSYSVRKGDIKRGSLQVMLATISISPKQRTIHIDSGTTIFHLKALSAESYDEWLNCIRAKRTAENFWNHDVHSVTSLVPELITTTEANLYERNHQVIVDSLNDLDADIKFLKDLITKDIVPILPMDPSSPIVEPDPQPSMKLMRFPFIRGSSSNHINTTEKRPTTMDRILNSIQLLSDHRDKLSTAYYDNFENGNNSNFRPINPLDVPSRTGTGFLSNRSASFYSFAQSDQFFDAEDFLLSNEDNESTYGSIDVDSEDEEEKDTGTHKLKYCAAHTECYM